MVTTRHIRGSYLNKVELLNGCLAVAHSNISIPSTLGGNCYTEKDLDEKQLAKRLALAMDVYIRKVDSAPCAKQPIRLVKGANVKSHESRLGTCLNNKNN